jgi:hypothetical protein
LALPLPFCLGAGPKVAGLNPRGVSTFGLSLLFLGLSALFGELRLNLSALLLGPSAFFVSLSALFVGSFSGFFQDPVSLGHLARGLGLKFGDVCD